MRNEVHSLGRLRVSLTNVQGEGAVQLVGSLLPAIELETSISISRMDLPDRGGLSGYTPQIENVELATYRRWLPNLISRYLECIRPLVNDNSDMLLVLGDIPFRTRSRQTVFIHNTHILENQAGCSRFQALKFGMMRRVFLSNLPFVKRAVVQTDLMRTQLIAKYPDLIGRVEVLRPPPPVWILNQKRVPRLPYEGAKLRLFYPATGYSHKNHILLVKLAAQPNVGEVIESITLTLNSSLVDNTGFVKHVGRLAPDAMIDHYANADALIFPSLSESYGLPLVEAMWLGMPIICADLPYARELCGSNAIYFDPYDASSAFSAVCALRERLASGWQPDWGKELALFPHNWGEVAHRLVDIVIDDS